MVGGECTDFQTAENKKSGALAPLKNLKLNK
jgi:hypothetical protein